MTPEHMTPLFSTRKALAEKHGLSLSPQVNALIFDVVDWAQRAQPATMFNGLTEAETDATASVFGLVGAQPASPLPPRIVALLQEAIECHWQGADGESLVEDARKALAAVKDSLTPGAQPASVPAGADWITEFCSKWSGNDLVAAGDVLDWLTRNIPSQAPQPEAQPHQGEFKTLDPDIAKFISDNLWDLAAPSVQAEPTDAEAEQMIDELGKHHAAVARITELGYVWDRGAWRWQAEQGGK